MPTTVVAISWNIRDLGADMVNDNDLIDFIATVLRNGGANFASILETKSNKGDDLGKKLKAKLGGTWDHHSSPPSAPKSNKPENYVFLWDGAAVTAGAGFKFPNDIDAATGKTIGFPRQHTGGKRPSRYPYLGTFTMGGKAVTVVSFHATFTAVDIAECNQKLGAIGEVRDRNVIVMGDFNDHPVNSKTYRGKKSFEPLTALNFSHHINTKTSLKHFFELSWLATTDCRSSLYDNFWVKTGGDVAVTSAEIIDCIDDLMVDAIVTTKPLSTKGKKVFNNWAARTNAFEKTAARESHWRRKGKAWVDIVPFAPSDKISTIEDAHEVYFVCVSDHLPIKLTFTVN